MEEINIGDIVYPVGCTKEYQIKNPMKVNFIREIIETVVSEGYPYKFHKKQVSQNLSGWYPITTVTKIIP